MNVALVTASGVGSRVGHQIPKQFLSVNDKMIIVYTLESLQRNDNIDKIIVACLDGWEKILASHVKQFNLTKVEWIVKGGDSGQESITNCLEELKPHISDDDLVIIHDGNRPLVSDFIVNESVRICKKHGNAVASIPVVEAVLEILDKSSNPISGLAFDRDQMVRTQTPHTFKFGDIYRSYEEIKNKNSEAVAPCTVMVELGRKVYFSPGSELNFKITTRDDLEIFKALISYKGADYEV